MDKRTYWLIILILILITMMLGATLGFTMWEIYNGSYESDKILTMFIELFAMTITSVLTWVTTKSYYSDKVEKLQKKIDTYEHPAGTRN